MRACRAIAVVAVLASWAVACGTSTTGAPSDAGSADVVADAYANIGKPCRSDSDCLQGSNARLQCGYAVADHCSAEARCFLECPPGPPVPACSCDGRPVSVGDGCDYSVWPIAPDDSCLDAGGEN